MVVTEVLVVEELEVRVNVQEVVVLEQVVEQMHGMVSVVTQELGLLLHLDLEVLVLVGFLILLLMLG